jgi:(p)ppGpp synthase/HD superfamily hydrolase
MNETENLKNIILAPWIIKATELIGKPRRVGGNAFRHQIATMAILLDYKMFEDYVLLKASVIHDLIEDCPKVNQQELRQVDEQGNEVVDLVLEVSKQSGETKKEFLNRILTKQSRNAKILKVADRISNITDLHIDQDTKQYMRTYLQDTVDYVLPMAEEVNKDMCRELSHLVEKRKKQMNFLKLPF